MYRFRLTPAYMFVLLIAEISMRWIHNYSVFEPMSQNHVSCDKYWWRNILYINSLYPMKDMVSTQYKLRKRRKLFVSV